MLFFLLKCLLGIVAALILLGVLRTWQMGHSADQKRFLAATAPAPAPDGSYAGTVASPHVSWLGKKFNAADSSGINVFDTSNGTKVERYPFATSSGKGLTDRDLNVLKIDYNVSANPFWLRPILDEIVQIGPDHYLGKMQARVIPGYPFTLAFFELTR